MKLISKILLVIVILSVTILCSTCRKKPKEEGTNKMYCKIDGKKFFAKHDIDHTHCFYGVAVTYFDTLLNIKTDNCRDEKIDDGAISIGLNDSDGLSIGQYILNATYESKHPSYFVYRTDSINTGSVDITKIEETGDGGTIIAARFSFTALSEDGSKTVEITDGWFDIKVNENGYNYIQ
ncbi:MAG: hypothetical protein COA57_16215 [Flavobacteriales bacterium]|nr:hypothetical protein [Bacteroidales bacterium AH-315-I05]PCJ78251.1 MAG: hypothetical protein COA57_16215 [Flavobacteriales bacterium]